MAEQPLTVRTISFGTYTPGATPKYAGLVVTTPLDTPEATGNYFLDNGRTFLMGNLSSGSTVTVTVDCIYPSDEGITTDVAVDVATGVTKAWGPFGARFQDASGYVHLTYSGITNFTIAAIRLAEKGRG